MRFLMEFYDYHTFGELMILGFFLTVFATVTGWVIEMAIRDRAIGVIGNSILIMMGTIVGWVAAETQGIGMHLPESRRILLFATASTGLLLLALCAIKSRRRVT